MGYFHPEEQHQVWSLYSYERDNPGTRYLITFPDGESYECLFDALYDSENGADLDIGEDNPLFDEFTQAALNIINIIHDGLRRVGDSLCLDYRDWPARINDIDTGRPVFPTPTITDQE